MRKNSAARAYHDSSPISSLATTPQIVILVLPNHMALGRIDLSPSVPVDEALDILRIRRIVLAGGATIVHEDQRTVVILLQFEDSVTKALDILAKNGIDAGTG